MKYSLDIIVITYYFENCAADIICNIQFIVRLSFAINYYYYYSNEIIAFNAFQSKVL